MVLLSGCVVHDGSRHWVVGFGVVSVNSTNRSAVVTDVKAVGVYVGPGTGNIGYVQQTRCDIQTNANVVIELK